MFYVIKRTVIIEEKSIIQYGIADEVTEYCCFTENKKEAEKLALLLNENNVESVHVLDIIEDTFYQ